MQGRWLGTLTGLTLGLTIPFFAVEIFRIPAPGGLQVPPAALVALVLAGAGIMGSLLRRDHGQERVSDLQRALLAAMILFFGWHLLGAARAEELGWAIKEVVKLGFGMTIFWMALLFIRFDSRNLSNLVITNLWVMAGLLGLLIYVYAVLYHAPYLGISLDEPTRSNRNQLAWMLATTVPYAASGYFRSRRPWLFLVPLMVLIAALAYTSSRASWICGGLGSMWALWESRSGSARRFALRALLIGAILGIGATLVVNASRSGPAPNSMDFVRKASTLTDPSLRGSDHSIELRSTLIEGSIESFAAQPVVGIGLTNLRLTYDYASHNDLLGILSEQGLVGIGLFLVIIVILGVMGLEHFHSGWLQPGARGSLLAVVTYMLFMNAYTTTMFWLTIAIALAIVRSDNSEETLARS